MKKHWTQVRNDEIVARAYYHAHYQAPGACQRNGTFWHEYVYSWRPARRLESAEVDGLEYFPNYGVQFIAR